jgi:adenine-specific DNA-methyltransferase
MGQNRKKGEPVAATSPDLVAERIAQLRELFPDVLSEGKVDVEKLRAALGEIADDRPERYSFSWAGKRDAIRLLQTPSRATLVPAPDESVNFDSTQNVFIEGDNLEVLKLLYKSYAGRVKMIYIDPPYNRPDGEDLIYNDNFADPLDPYLRLTGQKDEDGNLLTSKPETSGRLHSAWLTSIYPRLFVARQLLQEDGVIFVSIDDSELCNLRAVMNEVFGEENWVGTIVWKGATDNNPTQIAIEHEYILCYGRQKSNLAPVWKNLTEDAKTTLLAEYARLRKLSKNDPEWIQGKFRRFIKANAEVLSPLTHYSQVDERGPYTGSRKVHNPKPGGYVYDVIHPVTKKVCVPPANGYRFPRETMDRLLAEGRILFGKDETQIIQIKEYLEDYEGKLSSVISLDSRAAANEMEDLFGNRKLFPHPKPSILLRQVFDFCVSGEDLVLDFYAGSCSTAHAILENNRHDGLSCRFIMVQLQEP